MVDKPIVSIVIPCFNYGRFIADAIASVEKCDSRLYEIIIVNDGSTDAQTQKILKNLAQNGYHVINQENQGVSAARNTAVAAAKGKYILPLDPDDEIYPSYLQSAVDVLENNPEVGVVYGRAEFFGAKSGEWKLPKFDVAKLLIYNFIYVSAVYRREIWVESGGYHSETEYWEDWDFWISAAEKGWKFIQLDEMVFRYRIHDSSKMHQHRVTESVPAAIEKLIMQRHSEFYRKHLIDLKNASDQLQHWEKHPLRGIARLALIKLKRRRK